jgi:hypothetical protein
VSSALCTSESPWCQSRQCGPPREHGAPCASAPQSPSGNHRASSSWSRDPTGTTHSFHIELTGRGEDREEEKEGVSSPCLDPPGEPHPTNCPLPGPQASASLVQRAVKASEESQEMCVVGKLSLYSAPPAPLPKAWGPLPAAPRSLPGLLHSMVPLAAVEPSGQAG